jgi:hypothetical protein
LKIERPKLRVLRVDRIPGSVVHIDAGQPSNAHLLIGQQLCDLPHPATVYRNAPFGSDFVEHPLIADLEIGLLGDRLCGDRCSDETQWGPEGKHPPLHESVHFDLP